MLNNNKWLKYVNTQRNLIYFRKNSYERDIIILLIAVEAEERSLIPRVLLNDWRVIISYTVEV